jgi:uncharacterized membrane protein
MTTPHENQLKERIFDMFLILSLPVILVISIPYKERIIALANWFPIENSRPAIALMQLLLAFFAICWMTIKVCLLFQKRSSTAVRSEYGKDDKVR